MRVSIFPKDALNITHPTMPRAPSTAPLQQADGAQGLSGSSVLCLKWRLVFYNVTMRL